MKDAVDTQSDFVFMEEHFCGHGYHACDTTLQCYRGIQCSGGQPVDPANDVWFDVTCIHPTPVGHGHIADYFTATIDE